MVGLKEIETHLPQSPRKNKLLYPLAPLHLLKVSVIVLPLPFNFLKKF